MIWGFCVYFVYMIPLETDVLRKHRFQKWLLFSQFHVYFPNKITVSELCYNVTILQRHYRTMTIKWSLSYSICLCKIPW